MKASIIRARIEPQLKENVENVLNSLGMTSAEAIRVFFKQIELRKGLPFAVELPNKETERVFKATDKGENITQCDSTEEMFERLGI